MTNTEERKRQLLQAVVREYIKLAEPVGSETIVDKYDFGVSPATIRNDMADLEELGLLYQPHASAGRLPTVAGYRFYVAEFVRGDLAPLRDGSPIALALGDLQRDADHAMKSLARALASETGETVVVRNGDEAFVTGLSNMSAKPEFREGRQMAEMLRFIDNLDELVAGIERRFTADYAVFIGDDNPFGAAFASVLTSWESPNLGDTVIGILGPQRMDYDANVSMIRYLHQMLPR